MTDILPEFSTSEAQLVAPGNSSGGFGFVKELAESDAFMGKSVLVGGTDDDKIYYSGLGYAPQDWSKALPEGRVARLAVGQISITSEDSNRFSDVSKKIASALAPGGIFVTEASLYFHENSPESRRRLVAPLVDAGLSVFVEMGPLSSGIAESMFVQRVKVYAIKPEKHQD